MPNRTVFRIFITGTANVGKSSIANSLAGETISEVSPTPETTMITISKSILSNHGVEVRIIDLPSIGGLSGIKLHLHPIEIEKHRRKYRPSKGELISGIKSPLRKKNPITETYAKRGKSIILFVFDLSQGLKREDGLLLNELQTAFPKTKLIIVANKVDQVPPPGCDRAIEYYDFPASVPVITCSKNKADVVKLVEEINLCFNL